MKIFDKILRKVLISRGMEVIGLEQRPDYCGQSDRFSYQAKYHKFNIEPSHKVLDVGCGAYPFPFSTVLVDLYEGKTVHRAEELKTDNKPLIIANIEKLPFCDKSYDFVYCSHVLEHSDDPEVACKELMRIGKRGYIETPSLMTDVLFSWAKGMHKWFIIIIANRIVFFEYGDRLSRGVQNSYWQKSVFSKKHHPLQDLFYGNLDIFHSALIWESSFQYSIYYLDGTVKHSD